MTKMTKVPKVSYLLDLRNVGIELYAMKKSQEFFIPKYFRHFSSF